MRIALPGKENAFPLVINGKAGKGTRKAGLGRVVGGLLAADHPVYAPETLACLDTVAAQIHDERPGIVAIAGGDGTLHQTVSRLIREYVDSGSEAELPKVLLFPTGTMNVVASTLGTNRIPATALAHRIMAKVKDGRSLETTTVNTIDVNGEQFGFLYGAGFPVDLLKEYYRPGKRTGVNGVLRVFFRQLRAEMYSRMLHPRRPLALPPRIPVRMTFGNGEVVEDRPYSTVFASTVDQFAFGCRAFPNARAYDQAFLVRAMDTGMWGALGNVAPLWAGMPVRNAEDTITDEVIIEYDSPVPTQIDGDINEGTTTRDIIKAGPTLTFIVG